MNKADFDRIRQEVKETPEIKAIQKDIDYLKGIDAVFSGKYKLIPNSRRDAQ